MLLFIDDSGAIHGFYCSTTDTVLDFASLNYYKTDKHTFYMLEANHEGNIYSA